MNKQEEKKEQPKQQKKPRIVVARPQDMTHIKVKIDFDGNIISKTVQKPK
jgi:UDP-3-O-acyl-N-acetylglucosamine deacetylase